MSYDQIAKLHAIKNEVIFMNLSWATKNYNNKLYCLGNLLDTNDQQLEIKYPKFSKWTFYFLMDGFWQVYYSLNRLIHFTEYIYLCACIYVTVKLVE